MACFMLGFWIYTSLYFYVLMNLLSNLLLLIWLFRLFIFKDLLCLFILFLLIWLFRLFIIKDLLCLFWLLFFIFLLFLVSLFLYRLIRLIFLLFINVIIILSYFHSILLDLNFFIHAHLTQNLLISRLHILDLLFLFFFNHFLFFHITLCLLNLW